MTLKDMTTRLPEEKIVSIHRSYIVPVSKIRSIANKKVTRTNIELLVSDSYFDILKAPIKTL